MATEWERLGASAQSAYRQFVEVKVGAAACTVENFLFDVDSIPATCRGFLKRLLPTWKNQKDGRFELPDVDPVLFRAYLVWMKHQKLYFQEFIRKEGFDWSSFAQMYRMAIEFVDFDFRDRVLDALIMHSLLDLKQDVARQSSPPTPNSVHQIYRIASKGWPARRFIVDACVVYMARCDFEIDPSDYSQCQEFLQDMSRTLKTNHIISEKEFEIKWRDRALRSCDYMYMCCSDMSKQCEHACENEDISGDCGACFKNFTLRENIRKVLSLANMKRWIA